MATLVGLSLIVLGGLAFLFGAAWAVDRLLQHWAKTTKRPAGPTSTAPKEEA